MGQADVGEELAVEADVVAAVAGAGREAAALVDLLDRLGERRGAPIVDESERLRLEEHAADGPGSAGWYPVAARPHATAEREPIGYVGVSIDGEAAIADLAAEPGPAFTVLVAAARTLAERHDMSLDVWVRAADEELLAAAEEVGLKPARRLAVLGRALDAPAPSPDPPGGVILRSFEVDDEDAVVALLRTAYEGTSDDGWDLATFRERRQRDWFREEDLIVAEGRHGAIEGIHWTKRRGSGVGEVHNLAVAPDAQGLGLGRALLRYGLRHLWRVGCSQVLLWMDAANDAAVDLYRSEGFEPRWEDVLLRG